MVASPCSQLRWFLPYLSCPLKALEYHISSGNSGLWTGLSELRAFCQHWFRLERLRLVPDSGIDKTPAQCLIWRAKFVDLVVLSTINPLFYTAFLFQSFSILKTRVLALRLHGGSSVQSAHCSPLSPPLCGY